MVRPPPKYKTYFAMLENGTDEHRGNCYRSDYGPITILTLDSSNGEPDDHPQNYGGTGQPPKIKGQHQGIGTDTQSNFSRWSADEHEAEVWAVVDGVDQLVEGGKHYGHLEVNLTRLGDGSLLEMLLVHSFPLLDHDYNLLGTERRVYGDILRLRLGENGSPLYPILLRQPFGSAKTGF